jgi:VWFA-related protein
MGVLSDMDMTGEKRIWVRTSVIVCVVGLVLLSTIGLAESREKRDQKDAPQIPVRWLVWLNEEVYPLISKEQRQAFMALETEAQRKAFVERLWILWGRQSGIGTAFRSMYEERLAIARSELGNTIEDRARILLIHGPPTYRHQARCNAVFQPMDFWVWQYIEGLGEKVVVLFYEPDLLGRWKMWTSMDGYRRLYATGVQAESPGFGRTAPRGSFDSPEFKCPNGDVTVRLMQAAAQWSQDPSFLSAMNHFRNVEKGGLESTSYRFMEFSALLDDDAEPMDFSITTDSRGARGGLVEVGFAVDVPSGGLGTTPVGDVDVVQLDVVGEITSAGEVMVDRFRYIYSVPQAEDSVGLLLDRMLRPGDYMLRLKIEDVHSKLGSIVEQAFSVVALNFSEGAMDGFVDPRVAAIEAELEGEKEPEEQPTLRLVGPEGDAVSGLQRFEALALEEVQKVTFFLDNEAVLSKNRPPFDIDLNLGPLPRLTAVMVIGYDAKGTEIARDGYTLNVGRERFYVRLKPVSSADGVGGKVRIEAELNVPSDGSLEQLELYWNDEPLTTLHDPPYVADVDVAATGQFGYLRAVATLAGGDQAEDIQFVNSPQFGTVVKVTAIELPVTVLDNKGNPVEDLTIDDFTVYEDKVPQEISHFSLHRDLPVRMGMVLDTSGSMTTTLPTVQRVVMGFLRDLLRPRDRAFIETFSDRPDMLTGFTANFTIIENALLALYADRSTALYDAVVMGLFQFSGVTGRRAMVVLTDGDDTASENDFSDALGYAQRMGVTIYTIGVGISSTKVSTRWQLNKLAGATGGRSFFVSEKSELDDIYAEINRELRTQYLLAYTSNSEEPPDELRKIKVEVDRPRTKVRTISGYYPYGG